MPFGAWSPLPLRLGADPERGWSSQSQSRLAADLVAVRRTIPLAQITIDTSTGALISYTSQYGVGSVFAPSFSTIGAGHFGLAWAVAYQYFDETFYAFNIRSAELTAQGSAPVACTYNLNTGGGLPSFDFWCTNLATSAAASPIVTITVWGDWLPDRKIGDYDGATDKSDSLTEGDSSYCYDWSIELQAMRGSAYSTITGNVDAENFAMARQMGGPNKVARQHQSDGVVVRLCFGVGLQAGLFGGVECLWVPVERGAVGEGGGDEGCVGVRAGKAGVPEVGV